MKYIFSLDMAGVPTMAGEGLGQGAMTAKGQPCETR